MQLGQVVRRRLGGLEIPAVEAYRGLFINLDDLAGTLASVASPRRILDVGCGDGRFARRLTDTFANADYFGVDVVANPGALYDGDRQRASFQSVSTSELIRRGTTPFDLVIVVDVVHHVPVADRAGLLREARALTAPGGLVAVKDWERTRTAVHGLTWFADRVLSGDATVAFPTAGELTELLEHAFAGDERVLQARVPPHRNNVLHVFRRTV